MATARAFDGWGSLFWAAFNLSASPMILLDSNRVLVDVNDSFLRTFGYSRARALGRTLDRFVVEGSPQQMKTDWGELLRNGRLHGDREVVRADGRHVFAQFAALRALVTGRAFILGVVLDQDSRPMRCGQATGDPTARALTTREREVVAKVALGRRRGGRQGCPRPPPLRDSR